MKHFLMNLKGGRMRTVKKIKSLARIFLSKLLGRHVMCVLSLADESEIISFDVFDTLILRKCQPHEVFAFVSVKCGIKSFMSDRIEAEHRARMKSRREEVTLDEIYDELSVIYGNERIEELKALEIESEFEVIYPSSELKEFFDLMKQKHKRIIIISDMYLPVNIIEAMLERCGYDGYESVCVSSEYGLTKRHGSLFAHVLQDKGISPEKVLHIGDNMISDYIMPKQNGMKSFICK